MAIERFAKVHLVAHRSAREELVVELQRLGVVEIAPSEALPAAAAAPREGELVELLRRVDAAVARLAPHRPRPGLRERLFPRRRRVTEEELAGLGEEFGLGELLVRLEELHAREGEARAARERLERERRALAPWLALEVPLASLRPTRGVLVEAGFVAERDLGRLERHAGEAGGVAYRAGREGRLVAVVVFAHRAATDRLAEALAAVRFVPAALPALPATAAGRVATIDAELAELAAGIRAAGAAVAAEAGALGDLLAVRDLLAMRLERERARRLAGETRETVSLEGWMPEPLVGRAREALARRFPLLSFAAYEPGPADRVPVVLRNAAIARPFETVVELYGLPRYGGIDPTVPLAVFFAAFFGFCIADAGYGILLALAAGAGLALTPPELATRRRFLGLFALGGVSAGLVGAAGGSWLGASAPWRLFDPLRDLTGLFAAALALGAAHVFTGLLLRMGHELRRGRIFAPLVDQGLWLALVGSALVVLAAVAGVAPAGARGPAGAVAVFAAAGILCFQGRPDGRGRGAAEHLVWAGLAAGLGLLVLGAAWPWGATVSALSLGVALAASRGGLAAVLRRLGLGLYALYGAFGYLSDLLSYSRLVALGLGSATIAMVVNTMAGLALDVPVAGALIAAAVFLVGHLFNLAVALLGAFVHSARLQYVEFFTKFYGGGGRAFAPFRLAPRHVTIAPRGPGAGAVPGG